MYSADTSTSLSIIKGGEAGADAEAMEGAAYSLVPRDLLGLLIEPRAISAGMALSTVGWVLPLQSVIKKTPYSLIYGGIFSMKFLLSGNSSWC